MNADDIVLSADSVNAPAQRALSRNELPRGFWIGLACAAAVHAAFIIGVARHAPRYLGDPGGAADAINVELVDEADLKSREMDAGASPPPGSPVPPAQPQAPQPQQIPEPAAKEAAEKAPEKTAEQKAEQKAEQQAEVAPPEPEPPASLLPVEKEKPQPAPPQKEHAKESAQQKPAEAEPQQKMELKPPHELDLSLPKEMSMASPFDEVGRASSAVGRPPGITRSGENDEFGRGVIRALKKTMPPATGTKGRVTIKLILDERGNISSIKLLQPAGIRDLDDGVMFSAQQASFPFPPKGASVADRTFLITYVYK
jgi:periplasmic protein TonB